MSVSLGWIAPLFHTLKKRPLCRRRETRESWLSYYRAAVMLRGRTFTYRTGSPKMLSARSCTVKGIRPSLHLSLRHHQPQFGDRL